MNKFVPFFNNVINMKNANKVSNKKNILGIIQEVREQLSFNHQKKKKKNCLSSSQNFLVAVQLALALLL